MTTSIKRPQRSFTSGERIPFRYVAFRHAVPAILVGCLFLRATNTLGQDITELSLKAAFIHNFLKFAAWPRDVLAPGAPLTACVLGDAAFGGVLENYVKGHPVDGHEIHVSRTTADGNVRQCHLLYVSGITARQAAQALKPLDGAPTLTVSDIDPFARIGGMAQLYVQDGRIRFRVNLDTTKRARLSFSSKLLALATIVTDDPNALR